MKVQNDDWITIKPNGEENKGRHLLLKDGETPKEAIKRTWGVDLDKKKGKEESKFNDVLQRLQKQDAYSEASEDDKKAVEQITGKRYMDGVRIHQLIRSLKEKASPVSGRADDIKKHFEELAGFADLTAKGLSEKNIQALLEEKNAIQGTISKLNYSDSDIEQQLDKIEKRMQDYSDKKEKLEKEAEEKTKAKKEAVKKQEQSGKFNILKETDKAYLVEHGGRQAWIPKKRMSKSGDLTKAGRELFKQESKSNEAVERENAEREKGVELPPKADYESDKAYGYDIPVTIERKRYSIKTHDYYYPLERKKTRIFISKSMVKDGRIPTWLVEKKIDEAESRFYVQGDDDFEPKSHAQIKTIFKKAVYKEGGRSRLAFTQEYIDAIKPDPDFEDNRAFEVSDNHIKIGNSAIIFKIKDKFVTIYNDKWITVKPNGEENKGRHLLLEGGESPMDAMERKWHISEKKNKRTDTKKSDVQQEKTEARRKSEILSNDYKIAKETYDKLWKQYYSERFSSDDWRRREQLSRDVNEAKTAMRESLAKGINEISKSIRSSLSKYSPKTDKLVQSVASLPDEVSIKEQEIAKSKQEDEEANKKVETGEMSRTDAYILTTRNVVRRYEIAKELPAIKEKQIIENLKIINKRDTDFELKYKTSSMQDMSQKLSNALNGFIGKGIVSENDIVNVKKLRKGGRAFSSGDNISVTVEDDLGVAIHEYMHFLERHNPRILMNSLAFAKMRTGDEKTQSLRKLTGNTNYGRDERAKPDKFFDPYCGKVYSNNKTYDDADGSEIMSMGLQYLLTQPKKFAEEDREYFDFVIANIKGEI